MTKKEIVEDVTNVNAELVLAFLTARFPIFSIAIVRYIAKHYLMKWLEPMVNEGTVFIAFSVIDADQMRKWEYFDEAKARLMIALESGVPDEQSQIDFDRRFLDAIRIKP
jgi:hypothetical protein